MPDVKSYKDISVYLPNSNLHSHAVARIREEFSALDGNPSNLSAHALTSVRAIAAANTVIDARLIDTFPNLEIISYFGMGYETVDARHAADRQVVVTNTPDVMNEEVADATIGLLLMTVRELGKAENWLRAGNWAKGGTYPLSTASLRGRHVGIYGLGRIGLAIAARLEAFGLEISYHNRSPNPDVGYRFHPTLAELATAVDTLISVVPGGAATEKAVNQDILKALGPQGVFINVGRGSTVDQEALIQALSCGVIQAAGLDVFENEPEIPQTLLDLPNATILPHIASASEVTRRAVADLCVDNLISWFTDRKAKTPVRESLHLT